MGASEKAPNDRPHSSSFSLRSQAARPHNVINIDQSDQPHHPRTTHTQADPGRSIAQKTPPQNQGYFAYDTVECILRYETEGPEFLFHGVFCFATFSSLVFVRSMHWFGAGYLMWELSTPFVHFR